MLLEHHVPGRAATNIESYRLASSRGMTAADTVGFIDDNLAANGLRTVRGDLPEAIRSNQPFIAFVSEGADGHAVMVQGVREVDGVRYLVVRDPAHGAYLETITSFDARLVRDPNVLSHPVIWGQR